MPKMTETNKAKTRTIKKAVSPKAVAKKEAGLSVPLYTLDGKESGALELPKEIFLGKVNLQLLSQATRVFLNNQKAHFSHTKTRGEVVGSTRKIYRQKGTGRARHGAIRAPIFVGGGIALGPKYRKVVLDLPKKMKKAAVISALSQKVQEQEVLGVAQLDKATGKTAQIKKFVDALGKKNLLIVTDGKNEKFIRAVKNLPEVKAETAESLNVLDILGFKTLALTQEAVEKLTERVKGKGGLA